MSDLTFVWCVFLVIFSLILLKKVWAEQEEIAFNCIVLSIIIIVGVIMSLAFESAMITAAILTVGMVGYIDMDV